VTFVLSAGVSDFSPGKSGLLADGSGQFEVDLNLHTDAVGLIH
jgi:hypothetical protein